MHVTVARIIGIGNCKIDYVEDRNDFRGCDGIDDLFTLCRVYKLFYHIFIDVLQNDLQEIL